MLLRKCLTSASSKTSDHQGLQAMHGFFCAVRHYLLAIPPIYPTSLGNTVGCIYAPSKTAAFPIRNVATERHFTTAGHTCLSSSTRSTGNSPFVGYLSGRRNTSGGFTAVPQSPTTVHVSCPGCCPMAAIGDRAFAVAAARSWNSLPPRPAFSGAG